MKKLLILSFIFVFLINAKCENIFSDILTGLETANAKALAAATVIEENEKLITALANLNNIIQDITCFKNSDFAFYAGIGGSYGCLGNYSYNVAVFSYALGLAMYATATILNLSRAVKTITDIVKGKPIGQTEGELEDKLEGCQRLFDKAKSAMSEFNVTVSYSISHSVDIFSIPTYSRASSWRIGL